MDNILTSFLKALHIKYTQSYAINLYEKHPHKYDLYGISKMLEEYKIPNVSIKIAKEDIRFISPPFIAHIGTDFVIVKKITKEKINYLWNNKSITISKKQFLDLWSGVLLLAEPTSASIEPEYRIHFFKQTLNKIQTVLLIIIPIISFSWLFTMQKIEFTHTLLLLCYAIGTLVSLLLLQKQVYLHGKYADKICSLFKQKDCNNVLNSHAAKLFNWLSWSEIGLGYFISNIFIIILFPEFISCMAFINVCALPYVFWSIWYQYKVVRQWCILCLIIQGIIITTFFIVLHGEISQFSNLKIINFTNTGIIYLFFILLTNKISSWISKYKKSVNENKELNFIKNSVNVFKVLLKKQPYYPISNKDSNILFGNSNSTMRISVLTNPHCEPCARMHIEIEKLLQKAGDKLCIQYIFSSFNNSLLKSNYFLVAVYRNESINKTMQIYHQWYTKEKYNANSYMQRFHYKINDDSIKEEIQRHNMWKDKYKLSATPTILVNGYLLPKQYKIIDLLEFIDLTLDDEGTRIQ